MDAQNIGPHRPWLTFTLHGDTLAHAYRHSRINPRITHIKAAVGDKVDILIANGFQMHVIFPITVKFSAAVS